MKKDKKNIPAQPKTAGVFSLLAFCDKIIESCWLAALVVAPLFFNFHSSNVFDPDKSNLIHSLAIIMLVAFIIRMIEQPKNTASSSEPVRPMLKSPMVTAFLLLGLSYVFSTVISVTPHMSWWGSYSRAQGTYTLISYFIIFFITLLSIKTPAQINRIIMTVILTSIPICLYGLSQKLKLDPLTWDADFSYRIASTLGNPIFLGAYLIMVIPITLALILWSQVTSRTYAGQSEKRYSGSLSGSELLPGIVGCPKGGTADFSFRMDHNRHTSTAALLSTRTISLSVLLLLQITCLIMTLSRGPVLGLMVGLFFFIVLYGFTTGRKWLIWLSYAGVISAIGFLILLNIPGTPLKSIKPKFGRLGQIFDTKEPASRVRLLIWEGVIKMVKSDPARAVIGYGPEAMFVPYHKYASPELVRAENRIAFPDRAHNELFDTLITNGLIGGAVYIVLFGIIIFYALRWLGLVRNKTESIILITLLTLGAVGGILLPYLIFGVFTFAAVAVPLGLVTGSGIYLFYVALFLTPHEIASPRHFVSGLAMTVIARSPNETTKQSHTPSISSIIFIALFSAIIGHFVETQFGIALTGSRTYFYIFCAIIIAIVINNKWQEAPNIPISVSGSMLYSLCSLLILSVFAYNLITSNDMADKIFRSTALLIITWLSFHLFLGNPLRLAVMLITCAVFVLLLSLFLPPINSPLNALVIFYLWLGLNIAVIAYVLLKEEIVPPQRTSGLRSSANIPFYLMLIIAALVLIWMTNINPLRGNTLYKVGSGQEKQKNYDTALKYYDDALKLSVDKSYYYASIARIYMDKYQRESDLKQRLKWYDECYKYLIKSIAYDRLSPTRNANLGRLYRVWARDTAEPKERTDKFAESHKYYEIATSLTPSNPSLMNEWGEVYYEQGNTQKALEKYEASLKMTKDFSETYAHLGDVYLGIKDEAKALTNYLAAANIHSKWLEDLCDPNQDVLYLRTNQYIIQKQPDNYLGYFNLIYYYWQKGQRREMSEMAKKARPIAPPDIQKRIDEFLARLQ